MTWMTSSEAASTYGVSRDTLMRAVRAGKIESIEKYPGAPKLGLLLNVTDVENWCETKRTITLFTDADVAALMELAPSCSWEQVGAYLGKSAGVCKNKAAELRRKGFEVAKLPGSAYQLPFNVPATGILLAKTCSTCGIFRDRSQFRKGNGRKGLNGYPECYLCASKRNSRSESGMRNRSNLKALNDATRKEAINLRKPYTQADDEILRDTSISSLEAALTLGRTYQGIRTRRGVLGVRISGREYIKRADPQAVWVIRFPNAMLVLQEHFKSIGRPVPQSEWEWDEAIA